MIQFAMPEATAPKIPQYRMTLFYGPEQDETDADVVYCVFNVKKRSWKGGVQIVVELAQSQLARIRQMCDFDQWLRLSLGHLPESERQDYQVRGEDIFVQQVCLLKLQLAIGMGIRQENSRMAKDYLAQELQEAVKSGESIVKEEVLLELDIEAPRP